MDRTLFRTLIPYTSLLVPNVLYVLFNNNNNNNNNRDFEGREKRENRQAYFRRTLRTLEHPIFYKDSLF